MPTKREYLDSIADAHLGGWITVGCIPGPGTHNDRGYANVKVDGAFRGAHNYVLKRVAGDPPPDKREAAHTCRMKGCVNPAHLSWKSAKGNAEDRKRDGTEMMGEVNPKAKVNPDAVRDIRRLYAAGGWTYERLGERYGLYHSTIGRIVRGIYWPDI